MKHKQNIPNGTRVHTPHGVGVVRSFALGKGNSPHYTVLLDVPAPTALGGQAQNACCVAQDMRIIQEDA